jgi:hypothetical protein
MTTKCPIDRAIVIDRTHEHDCAAGVATVVIWRSARLSWAAATRRSAPDSLLTVEHTRHLISYSKTIHSPNWRAAAALARQFPGSYPAVRLRCRRWSSHFPFVAPACSCSLSPRASTTVATHSTRMLTVPTCRCIIDVATVHIDAGAVLMPPFGPSRRLAVAFARLPREVAHAFAEGTDGQR